MGFPKKLILFVCLLFYFTCTIDVSGTLTECETKVLKIYKNPNYSPKKYFLSSFLNLNDRSFTIEGQYIQEARNYFDDLWDLASLPNPQDVPTPRLYCIQTYGHPQEHKCVQAIAKLGCSADMEGLQALQRVYNNIIYKQVQVNRLYNQNQESNKIMLDYLKFLYGIIQPLEHASCRSIKAFCDPDN